MKTATTAMFLGALALGLAAGRAPLHAQPALEAQPASATQPAPKAQPAPTSSSISIEGDDKPWNRGVPIATRQASREVFLEGNRLFNIPLFAQAADKYLTALTTWKHPAFNFNLALAQLNLGQDVEAHENLVEAMRLGPEPLGADHYEEAQKQLQELERKLGRIRVTCPTPGAEITLDGAPLYTGPGSHEAWVKAKEHELAVKKPGYLSQSKRVAVSPGKREAVDLHLRQLVEERPFANWKPWTLVGTGAAVLAASGVLHAFSARNFSGFDSKFLDLPCANSGGCMEDAIRPLLAELTRARLEQKIAIGGYIAGGTLLAAGAVLQYLNKPHLVEREATGVAVVPAISADTLGVLVTVSH